MPALLLLSAFMPVVVHANCLTEIDAPVRPPAQRFVSGLLKYVLNARKERSATEQYEDLSSVFEKDTILVPTQSMSAMDRQHAETAIEGQVEFVVCARIILDAGPTSPQTQNSRVHTGYFALTPQSVVFSSEAPNNQILFDATYAEIELFLVRIAPFGFPVTLRNSSAGAEFLLPTGSDGDALLRELHRRVAAACKAPAQITTNMVSCR
jgi:hypothetical protein